MVYPVSCTAACGYIKSWGGPSKFFGGPGPPWPPSGCALADCQRQTKPVACFSLFCSNYVVFFCWLVCAQLLRNSFCVIFSAEPCYKKWSTDWCGVPIATVKHQTIPLRLKAGVDKLIEKTDVPAECPLHNYVYLPRWNCLPSHRPLWTDTHPTNIISQWRDEWKSAPVVNSSLVDDPTIWQPGFDRPRHCWALLNHFWTNQGHYTSCRKKWGLAATHTCPCGKRQTMSHIVNSCPQSKLEEAAAIALATEWLKTHGL